MTYEKPVNIMGNLRDGRVFGSDEDGGGYVGTLHEVDRSELVVDTTISTDRKSYERLLVYENQVIARSTCTKDAYHEMQSMTRQKDLSDDAFDEFVDDEWEKELAVTSLPTSVHKEPVIFWTEV